MGRPKKDGKMLNCYLDSHLFDLMEMCCTMTGLTKTALLEKALSQFLGPYESDGGHPILATYLAGSSKYEQAVAINEGRAVEIREEPCYVLGECTMMGAPYYRIFKDNQLMKVPREMIRLTDV